MAFKKQIKGKLSTFYYVDFWVGNKGAPDAIHINKSTRTSDYKEACDIEERWRAEAEELYLRESDGYCDTDAFTLQEAIEMVWKKHWKHIASGWRMRERVEMIMRFVGNVSLTEMYGRKGYFLLDGVKEWLDNPVERTRSTVDSYLANWLTLLNYTREDLQLYDLVIPPVKLFRENKRRTKTISYEEEVKLFTYCEKHCPDYADLFKVLLDTGMRVSEPLLMTYDDHIFMDMRKITLTEDITKNGKIKSVPMTKRVHKILLRRLAENPVRPFAMTQKHVSRMFRQSCRAVGLPETLKTHSLRHSCTTRLIQQDINHKKVQKWLGHSDAVMTEHYTHLEVEDLRDGAAILDQLNKVIFDKKVIDDKGISKMAPFSPKNQVGKLQHDNRPHNRDR